MKKLFALIAILSWGWTGFAQDEPATEEPEEPATEFVFKPTVGLEVGMLSFYGDYSSSNSSNNPIVNRLGYQLRVSQPLNDFLDLNFFMLLGKVGANERTLERNLNFESRLVGGGLSLTYNFDHLLKPDRIIEPYFSIGIESIEFLSKTDRIDAFGNPYFYWTDGSIRNLPETDENLNTAVRIQRDFEYETDIRNLNEDGFGDYNERTFAIPISAGATMHVTPQVDFRIGTSLHYTFTDYIDGITDESLNEREGNGANDMFLFTSVSLSYNLSTIGRNKQTPDVSDEVDPLLATTDSDGDGIFDLLDECPETPEGVTVDEAGCPLDGDGDGVPDYADQQLDTPPGTPVDSLGIALSDDQLELIYLEYMDESGKYSKFQNQTYTMQQPDDIVRKKRKFLVQVGDNTTGISQEEVDRILSIPNVQTIEDPDGTIRYVVGEFESLPEAIQARMQYEESGIATSSVLMQEPSGDVETVIATEATPSRIAPIDAVVTIPGGDAEFAGKTVYRVQIGAYSRKLPSEIFEDVPDLVIAEANDGLTRYYSGSFTNYNDAAKRKIDLLTAGFGDAFVIPFNNGTRIPLRNAGATPAANVAPRGSSASANQGLVKFKVQIGSYANEVPTDVVEKFVTLGKIDQVKGSDGATRYFVGEFDGYQEATSFKQQLISQGIEGAFVVGKYKGEIISAQEAIDLLR